jgi:hypothetical protein
MKIAINTRINYKPSKDDSAAFHSLASEFENVDFSVDELAYSIACGFPFCAQHHGRRNADTFHASDYLAVDIDDGMSVVEAVDIPYVKNYAAIVYHTTNSTPEHNRFRIIFALARTISSRAEMEQAYTGVIRKFQGDGACKDACRLFFGNKGCTPLVLNNTLPNEMLDELILLGAQKRTRAEIQREEITSQTTVHRASLTWQHGQSVQKPSGGIFAPADLEKGTVVFCPVHLDKRPSAFITESRSGIKGVYCSTCATTFWPPDMKSNDHYDFYAIDNDLQHLEYFEDPWNSYDQDAPDEFFSDEFRTVRSSNSRFLSGLEFKKGVTLVRSPKGSGKSESIAKYVQQCRQKNLSVLLIGHRQSLISSLANRLGLDCYLDHRDEVSKYYAISLDSMPKILRLWKHKFDVVIIDEVEQVLAHMASDTLQRNRRHCFLMLQRYISRAHSLLACDADLGYLTVSTISAARNGEMPTQFYINRFKESGRAIEIYKSENQLLAELLENISKGGRYFVCSNSKRKAQLIHQAVLNSGSKANAILITSDNSKSAEIRHFLNNINIEIEKYDVVIASPSIGTGIDISFPHDDQRVNGVYGFFGARINSHFEIDQQLSRVRNPREVKVWISPETFSFEVEPDAIKRNCIELGLVPDAKISLNVDDMIVFDEDDPLLDLVAEVLSHNRASKNNLKRHFIELKVRNGWQVRIVETNEVSGAHGSMARRSARDSLISIHMEQLCKADKLDHQSVLRLKRLSVLSLAEQLALERNAIEAFYGEDISADLVKLDANGNTRKKIVLLGYYLKDALDFEQCAQAPTTKSVGGLLWHLFRASSLTDENGFFIAEKLISNRMLANFVKVCLEVRPEIETLLGLSLRNDILTKPVAQLGEMLRLVGCNWRRPIKRDVAGIRTHFYQVDIEQYEALKKYALCEKP